MLKVTTETKAVMPCDRGRVVGFVKSDEPGKISLAVPNDRAVMTPAQARQLAAWLVEEAGKVAPSRTSGDWRTAERQRQDEIRRALDTDRAYGGFRRA